MVGFLGSKAERGQRVNEEISEKGGQEARDRLGLGRFRLYFILFLFWVIKKRAKEFGSV